MEKGEPALREGKSLEETPTWALATVITVMVAFGFLVHHSLKRFGRWLEKTKRKSLLAASEKIEEAKLCLRLLFMLRLHCIKPPRDLEAAAHRQHELHDYCPEGKDSFASYESLEQLHHFVFVLGVTHVSYTFIAIALAMIKIYSGRAWENHAKASAAQPLQGASLLAVNSFLGMPLYPKVLLRVIAN
ncbi:hypothetical protein F3Y22_tig00110733pilonHSYRG00053 [Hibiscus syriacus]|uniref:MLO-like protein n=1 Tax=Hibiscus syriacus TaxID=106335 RepID=A0A6A2ZTM0_HIBSY|nr:hypothetical protein F3Y22_tig00110733pilonHSYRG00053 [Hibiscus syriacus]